MKATQPEPQQGLRQQIDACFVPHDDHSWPDVHCKQTRDNLAQLIEQTLNDCLPEKQVPYMVADSPPKYTEPVVLETVIEGMEHQHIISRNHGFNKAIEQTKANFKRRLEQ